MERKQFTFYRSFWEGIKEIKSNSARCAAYDAIVGYALDGDVPDLDRLPDAARIAFKLARPNLDASRKKAEAGRKGGESKDEANESKPQANRKQTQAKPNQEIEQVKEQVKEQMLKESVKKSRTAFQAPTPSEVAEYCRERGNTVNAQRFCDFYGRQGWRLNNGQPMKDWKAAVRLWERDEKKPAQKNTLPAEDVRDLYSALLAEEQEAL